MNIETLSNLLLTAEDVSFSNGTNPYIFLSKSDIRSFLFSLKESNYTEEYSNFRSKDCIVFKSKIKSYICNNRIEKCDLSDYTGFGRVLTLQIKSKKIIDNIFIVHDFELLYKSFYNNDFGYYEGIYFLNDFPKSLQKDLNVDELINCINYYFNRFNQEKPDWLKNLEILK